MDENMCIECSARTFHVLMLIPPNTALMPQAVQACLNERSLFCVCMHLCVFAFGNPHGAGSCIHFTGLRINSLPP